MDEYQNSDVSEIYSVLTRLGENSRIILCGDTNQNDLTRKREQSCHDWIIKVAHQMPNYFDVVSFYPNDIVRSEFVKALIMTVENMEGK
jgi:phosphate starvation-inducible PhoH-like protein